MSLITTLDEFRAHVGVNKGTFTLASVQPDMRLVELYRVKPLVGPAFFNQLDAKLKAKSELTAAEQEVLALLQCAVATLSMVEYLPLNQVEISDMGVHITTTGDKKTAFQWQIDRLLSGWTKKGYNALERALDLLDENIEAPEFEAWATSAARTASLKFFLNTAVQFSEHYNIGNSRLTYLAMLPTLRKMERFSIEPVLGPSYYLELKQQVLDRSLTAENEQVMELYVRPALAHLTVGKAVPELGLGLNGDAIELNVYRLDDSNRKESDGSIDALLAMKVQQALSDADVFLTRLRTHLNANASATKYATYFGSASYQAPGTPRPTVVTPKDSPIYGWLG
ncbi:DUF6712 family protein [Hymenobacter crusticola]|uniref:Uncharacterized protein n=1 Tax=Hymenobacter crusticola TaxID=1770526 RepID=A0A243W783_9BACT|nr:DUF6712 family protein [Hymenobacter crusticola]OUJ68819.1 hypothetical protein BXP70_27365 [Hymenobacter crusticola]